MHSGIEAQRGMHMGGYWIDILAVGFFVLEWTVYAVTLEHSAYGRDSLSARMHGYREIWIRRMLDREARMVDMQIMASLQNDTAFFASTSLLAVGGGLALLRSTSEALAVLHELPIDLSPSPALWEIKCVGLILIFIYAFFKFARLIGCSTTSPSCWARCRRPRSATRLKRKRMSFGPQDCSKPRGGTSTAASARSSSRLAISAGSSAHGSCSPRRRLW
jgi:hypothetical protein